MEKFILVMQCKNCSKVFSSVNKALEHVCPEECGTQPTDVQQLKQSIALVRQFAKSIPAHQGYCIFNDYLDNIERHACI